MKYFKVFFENNIPISAERLFELVYDDIINISVENNNRYIKWLIVHADNETEAVKAAIDLLIKYSAFFGLSGL